MIPRCAHFLFGFQSDFAGFPFSLVHFLAIKSMVVAAGIKDVRLYYKYAGSGPWWDRASELVTLVPYEPPLTVNGAPLVASAHQADYARLQILAEDGGVYSDADVIWVRACDQLLQYEAVVGEQGIRAEEGVGNAVILAEPRSPFILDWLEGFDSRTSDWEGFRSSGRDINYLEYSTWYPRHLVRKIAPRVHVEPYTSFYWPRAQESHFRWMYEESGTDFSKAYCHHLWESLCWDRYLSKLTVEGLRASSSNFARIVAPFLSDL